MLDLKITMIDPETGKEIVRVFSTFLSFEQAYAYCEKSGFKVLNISTI